MAIRGARHASPASPTDRQKLSVVAPAYNEVDNIEPFVNSLLVVMKALPYDFAIVLVNDGATDGTGDVLDRMQTAHPNCLTVLHLSRNFGHQAALTAGMDYADGDAVICMDADLQHPTSLITELVDRWEQGYDIVQAVRRQTVSAGPLKELTARAFYFLVNALSATRIEPSACDFRLVSRRVADVFREELRERDRFVRGLVSWVGFRSCCVEFDAAPRFAGYSKYSIGKMLGFARTGLISFSKTPLKVAVILGLSASAISLLYGTFAVFAYVFLNKMVMPGWASTIVVGTFLGGCQLLVLGIIGEYIATIFDETKGRPLYIVAQAREATPAPVISTTDIDHADPGRSRQR